MVNNFKSSSIFTLGHISRFCFVEFSPPIIVKSEQNSPSYKRNSSLFAWNGDINRNRSRLMLLVYQPALCKVLSNSYQPFTREECTIYTRPQALPIQIKTNNNCMMVYETWIYLELSLIQYYYLENTRSFIYTAHSIHNICAYLCSLHL